MTSTNTPQAAAIDADQFLHQASDITVTILGRADEYARSIPLPLAGGEVRAGFPSPAEDYLEGELDLTRHLIQHPNATYYVRAKGDSMEGYGIYDRDLLIVDRALDAHTDDILIAAVDGELTCKRLGIIDGCPALLSGNPAYPPIRLQGREVTTWGVVIYNVHALCRRVTR